MRTQTEAARFPPVTAALALCGLLIQSLAFDSNANGQGIWFPQPAQAQTLLSQPPPGDWVISPDGTKYYLFSNGSNGVFWTVPVPSLSNQTAAQQSHLFNERLPSPAPMSNQMVDAMVSDLEKIRENQGSVVSRAFHALDPAGSQEEVFRQELIHLATDPQHEQTQLPIVTPEGNRPLPFRVFQPGQYVGSGNRNSVSPQPLQPLPIKMPVSDRFSDQAVGFQNSIGAGVPSHDAVSLRRIARTLDEAAADLEEIGRFEEADDIRQQAYGLRILGRGTGR